MTSAVDSPLPNDVATLQTMLLSERAARMAAESEAKFRALLIEKLKYTIAKLRHERFGQGRLNNVTDPPRFSPDAYPFPAHAWPVDSSSRSPAIFVSLRMVTT
jgi:hypothetical protein